MKKVKPGDVYYAFRSDIENPHPKYQLYFDDETVLFINTKESKASVTVTVTVKDCPILDYDSQLCIDTVFEYQKNCKVLKITQLSTSMLERLKVMINMSTYLSGKQIKKIEKAIAMALAERKLR